jgi:DNA repair protein RadC
MRAFSSVEESNDDLAIAHALAILSRRLRHRDVLADTASIKHYLRLQAQGLDHEVFAIMHLDAHHRLIAYERLFRGSLGGASVYPREVVKQALAMNAAAVVLHHNHPSGVCLPSNADAETTGILKSALSLVEVRVLDHIITSDSGACSMAECGLI